MSSIDTYHRGIRFFAAIVLVLTAGMPVLAPSQAAAAELATRSVQISSSTPNEIVSHQFSFSTAGPSTIASIGFEYCTNSPIHELPCVAPSGLDVSSSSVDEQTGINGFTVSAATSANVVALTRTASLEAPTAATYDFSNIVNPSATDEIVFVRISVYDGVNLTGTRVDRGSVVFVTGDPYDVTAFVPPFLVFCVGVTVALDCSTSNGALVELGELSTVEPTVGTSQLSVSTNDASGYNVFLQGRTMTSGNNVIPALTTSTPSVPSTSQFGINLRSNTNPSVGANPDSGPVASGAPDPDYNIANRFRFVDGDRIARSSNSTGYNRYTVSYLTNVSNDQPPGRYAATFTYTAIASF